MSATQKLFWVLLRRFWSGWRKPLVLVAPRTVVEWHRAGFRLYWKWLSKARHAGGRKPVGREIRELIVVEQTSVEQLETPAALKSGPSVLTKTGFEESQVMVAGLGRILHVAVAVEELNDEGGMLPPQGDLPLQIGS